MLGHTLTLLKLNTLYEQSTVRPERKNHFHNFFTIALGVLFILLNDNTQIVR
jgi:hypothetical protein